MSKFKSKFIKLFSFLFAVSVGLAVTSMPAKAEGQVADFSVSQGAQIRDPKDDSLIGLQFTSTVNEAWLTENSAESYTFGTLIYPSANESRFDGTKSPTELENESSLDAANIVHVANQSVTAGDTFNASIVFDKDSVSKAIEKKGHTATDKLVDSVLKNLYNKDFTARSYAIVNGETTYTENSYSTSMYKIAARTYAKGESESNQSYKDKALNYFESASVKSAEIYGDNFVLTFGESINFSENAIVILNNEVLTKQVDYNVEDGAIVFTYSKMDSLTAGEYTFYVIDDDESLDMSNVDESNTKDWLDVLTVANAKYLPIKRLNVIESKVGYTPTGNASDYLKFNYVYDAGNDEEKVGTTEYSLNEDNVYSVEIVEEGEKTYANVTVHVTVFYEDTYVGTCKIDVTDSNTYSVTNFLATEIGNDVRLNGIVVGFATNIDQNEVILTDGDNFISVVGLGGGDVVNGSYYLNGIKIGDEISILASRQTSEVGANNGKVYAQYAGGSDTAVSVLSEDNDVLIETTETTPEITNTETLTSFLNNSEQYTVVKLNAEMNFVLDDSRELYNFWLYDDADATSLEGIKVNGYIPTFSGPSTEMNAGQTFSKLLFDGNASSQDYANPHNAFKSITALYLGGNASYAQFVILSADAVGNATAYVDTESTELNPPTKLKYSLAEVKGGFTPDLEGCTIGYVYTNRSGVTVEVTEEMLKTVPNITIAGDYGIEIQGEGWSGEFIITVENLKIQSVEVDAGSMPKYNHRNTLSDVSFEGVSATITYEDGSTTTLTLSDGMIVDAPTEWALDTELTYTLTYSESNFTLPITFVNEALSISDFWTKYEAGEIVLNDVIDVMGVVINPAMAYSTAGADFILKDTTTNDVLPLLYTEQYDENLDPVDGFNEDAAVGEVIIVEIIVRKTTATNVGNYGKVWGNATDKATFDASVINVTNYVEATKDFDLASAQVISSQDELIDFIGTRKTQIVKLDGVRLAYKSTSYYALFFDESFDAEDDAKSTITPKFLITLYLATTKKYVPTATLNTYLTKNLTSAATYTDPATLSEGSYMYAMFIGGNKSYLMFAILDDSWVGTTQAE